MFLLNALAGIIATFLIFSHSYEGREYSFIIGYCVILLLLAFRYEKGYSLSKTMFTCILLPLAGAVALGAYEYRDLFMKNLDQVVASYVAYQFVFILTGVIATLVFLYKLMVSRILYNYRKKLHNKNHVIYMSGSTEKYLSKEEIAGIDRRGQISADVAVFGFIVLTTAMVALVPQLGLKSEELRIELSADPGICLAACWIFAMICIFNSGIAMVGSLALMVAATLGTHMLVKYGFSGEMLKQNAVVMAWLLVPSAAAVLLRELKIIPSFEDY
ncbi:MAG: hypothetical protein IJ523_01610 [Succinivibrionaceae bacterium]|nr:hypothetical protein [Succinivibrionaceae bacterium]